MAAGESFKCAESVASDAGLCPRAVAAPVGVPAAFPGEVPSTPGSLFPRLLFAIAGPSPLIGDGGLSRAERRKREDKRFT